MIKEEIKTKYGKKKKMVGGCFLLLVISEEPHPRPS
jgi:hypothetical protein